LKIIVGITGASGTQIGFKFLSYIPKEIEVFAIISNAAKVTLNLEENKRYQELENITYLDDSNLAACVSSGSFKTDGYIIVPCSMNTLAKCTIGCTM